LKLITQAGAVGSAIGSVASATARVSEVMGRFLREQAVAVISVNL
jgi:hypothetical protein